MQIAEILSDLTSLRVCDPTAALALVSARPAPTAKTSATAPLHNEPGTEALGQQDKGAAEDADADIQRAKELVKLHYEVREKQKRGELGRGLEEARRKVVGIGGG
ncbi:hypothetical protein M011DRAFT_416871, partial [Sporormia fimetaria CBS 119925]